MYARSIFCNEDTYGMIYERYMYYKNGCIYFPKSQKYNQNMSKFNEISWNIIKMSISQEYNQNMCNILNIMKYITKYHEIFIVSVYNHSNVIYINSITFD